MDELTKAVLLAWRIEGRSPVYHRAQKSRLRRQWPMLYDAINELDKGAS